MLSDPLAHQERATWRSIAFLNCTRFAGGWVTHERHGFVFDDQCGPNTLLFSQEKTLLKLPHLDLPCRQWVRGRANIRPRGRSGEDGEALPRRGGLSGGRSILRIGPRQRRGASS